MPTYLHNTYAHTAGGAVSFGLATPPGIVYNII